jgi:hypothetical protein
MLHTSVEDKNFQDKIKCMMLHTCIVRCISYIFGLLEDLNVIRVMKYVKNEFQRRKGRRVTHNKKGTSKTDGLKS